MKQLNWSLFVHKGFVMGMVLTIVSGGLQISKQQEELYLSDDRN